MEFKVTFIDKDEKIGSERHLILGVSDTNIAAIEAIRYTVGLDEKMSYEYKKWDDPEITERKIIKVELITD